MITTRRVSNVLTSCLRTVGPTSLRDLTDSPLDWPFSSVGRVLAWHVQGPAFVPSLHKLVLVTRACDLSGLRGGSRRIWSSRSPLVMKVTLLLWRLRQKDTKGKCCLAFRTDLKAKSG